MANDDESMEIKFSMWDWSTIFSSIEEAIKRIDNREERRFQGLNYGQWKRELKGIRKTIIESGKKRNYNFE